MSTREIARVALSDRVPLTTPFAPLTVVVQNPEGTSIRFDFDYLDPRCGGVAKGSRALGHCERHQHKGTAIFVHHVTYVPALTAPLHAVVYDDDDVCCLLKRHGSQMVCPLFFCGRCRRQPSPF